MTSMTGRIVSIALKPERKAPMEEVGDALAVADGGLENSVAPPAERGLTIIAREQWDEVQAELGVDLPWHTRRANILTEGLVMKELTGKTLRIGEVEVAVGSENEPCQLMEDLHAGLWDVLRPDCRGGVYGRITQGGAIKVGDAIEVL
jgi:MOSC domain-containing protein YiiM